MADFEMLDRVLGHIEAHPENHDQDKYGLRNECRTTMCIAGHAVTMAGLKTNWKVLPNGSQFMVTSDLPNGETVQVFTAAQQVLGLTVDQAIQLFYCYDNDIDVLKGIVKEWANEQ